MRKIAIAAWFCSVSLSLLAAEPVPLIQLTAEKLPNDTNGDVQLKYVSGAGDAKLLEAAMGAGSSFGQTRPPQKNWSAAGKLVLEVVNSGTSPAKLTLVIKHAGSRNFDKRIDRELTLKPGRQSFTWPLADLRNNDGTRPDLANVSHWYFSAPNAIALQIAALRLDPPDVTTIDTLVKPGQTLPEIAQPVMFNTPEADRIMSALQLYPPNNPWNEDISQRPVAANSKQVIATMDPNRHFYFNSDMGYIIVPPGQKRVDVKITGYAGESDPGPYPVPDNAPIEGWPVYEADLQKIQREGKGDRHLIVLDPHAGLLHEFFVARRTDAGWEAACEATFNLKSNALRPDGWTSADAAGLPILPAVVRFDEVERGMVEHAMRFTARRTRRAYVYPATHFASRSNDENLPRMGDRFRLRADFDISGFSPHAQAVLKGLKKYGMILADNGVNWAISVAPDKRIKGLEALTKVKGRDFELIVPTGPQQGPRTK